MIMVLVNMRAMSANTVIPPMPQTSSPAVPEARMVTTDALFQSARSLVIEHGGERYILRLTRNGKLILTK